MSETKPTGWGVTGLHTAHRCNTNIVWSLLIATLAAWSIYNVHQHDRANIIKSTNNLSLQGDVVDAWTQLHQDSIDSSTPFPTETHKIDANRSLQQSNSTQFTLKTASNSGVDLSIWEIKKGDHHKSDNDITLTEQKIGDQHYLKLQKPLTTNANCITCHGDQTMYYSVAIAEDSAHKRREILSLLGGYLLLLAVGITLSTINHNRLLRNAKTKRIYENKLQDQYESQKAIAAILEQAISNSKLSDKLNHVLDIITNISWLQVASRGIIFTSKDRSLVMTATKEIPETLKQRCHHVAFGECLCGTAANKRLTQYTPGEGRNTNDITCHIESHGHYCIPIIHEDELLGLMTLYVENGHHVSPDERKFLTAACNSIGTMIHKNRIEEQLRYDAYHDPLTGKANRNLLAVKVNQRISRSQHDKREDFCLLLLDLDRFKYINDSLGHHIGDSILIETAARLEKLLREHDVIARLGGDEFALLLDNVECLNTVYRIADRIHYAVEQSIHIDSYDLHTTCRIGIAYYKNNYSSFDKMLRDADNAMHTAKSSSTDKTVNFDQHMHRMAMKTMSIESALRTANTKRELVAHFQPIYSTSEKRFIGAETLIRWNRNGKITPPSDFIGIAEDSGIIIMLGEYVLHEACKMISQLRMNQQNTDFYISVNISAKQMLHRNLIEMIDTILETHETPTKYLRLEITESLYADNSPLITEHMIKIKERGIKLLIDDFGTGYSSLSFLHKHPFDCVKIDRSFVTDLGIGDSQQRPQKMVKTIIDLAKNLEMSVIAEGVEELHQLDYLNAAGCHLIQGYLFSRPLPPMRFIQEFSSRPVVQPQLSPLHLVALPQKLPPDYASGHSEKG